MLDDAEDPVRTQQPKRVACQRYPKRIGKVMVDANRGDEIERTGVEGQGVFRLMADVEIRASDASGRSLNRLLLAGR